MMRQSERAVLDLRRGEPVVVEGDGKLTLVQSVEALAHDSTLESLKLPGEPRALVLTRQRLASLGVNWKGEAGSIAAPAKWPAARVTELAAGAPAENPPAPRAPTAPELAGLALARNSWLLPAVLAIPISEADAPHARSLVDDGTLLQIPASQALGAAPAGCGRVHRVHRVSEARIPLAQAEDSRFTLFREADGLFEHVAVLIGDPTAWPQTVPLRIHSACLTGDLFGSLRCDCGEQLRGGVAAIAARGGGILLYLAQEGRGIGLANKLRAYSLQDGGLDTLDADQSLGFGADERDYTVAAAILGELGVATVQLLTNNPAKIAALESHGIRVAGRAALLGQVNGHNRAYLTTKAERSGHWLRDSLGSQGDTGRGRRHESQAD